MTRDDRIHAQKATLLLLKYTPVAVGLLQMLYCWFRAADIRIGAVADILASSGLLWMPLLYCSSIGRGFCRCHRILITYDTIVSVYVSLIFILPRQLAGTERFCCWLFFWVGVVLVGTCRRARPDPNPWPCFEPKTANSPQQNEDGRIKV